MKCMIVEDDMISGRVMGKMIAKHANFDTVADGRQALALFLEALESGSPYDLILMDIMMPEVDGLVSLQGMRQKEIAMKIPWSRRVKVIMTTALDDPRSMMKALFEVDANSYLVKPIRLQKLEEELRVLKLIP